MIGYNSVGKVCGSEGPGAGSHPPDPLVVDGGQQAEGLDVQPRLRDVNGPSPLRLSIITCHTWEKSQSIVKLDENKTLGLAFCEDLVQLGNLSIQSLIARLCQIQLVSCVGEMDMQITKRSTGCTNSLESNITLKIFDNVLNLHSGVSSLRFPVAAHVHPSGCHSFRDFWFRFFIRYPLDLVEICWAAWGGLRLD